MSREINDGLRFYLAMCQVYKPVLDENGGGVYEKYYPYPDSPRAETRAYCYNRAKYEPDPGKFRAFGANGKVVSAYDSPGKAQRYCGKSGFVMEINPEDGLKVGCTPEEQLAHCEARMLFWGQEADRIQAEMRAVND